MAPVTTMCIICAFLCTSFLSATGLDDNCEIYPVNVREGVINHFACHEIPHYDERWWYRGSADGTGMKLYHQKNGGAITKVTNITRPDMNVDADFQLALLIKLHDHNTQYTCETIEYNDYSHCKQFGLQVYVQPEITLTGIDAGERFSKGDEVTVTCVLERMYPEMENPNKFWLRMGENWEYPMAPISNADGSFRYEIKAKWVLNTWDKYVTCEVAPSSGDRQIERRSFVVQGGSTARPAMGMLLSGIILYYFTMAA